MTEESSPGIGHRLRNSGGRLSSDSFVEPSEDGVGSPSFGHDVVQSMSRPARSHGRMIALFGVRLTQLCRVSERRYREGSTIAWRVNLAQCQKQTYGVHVTVPYTATSLRH